MRIGAIEAGGTKFVCGVGNELGRLRIGFIFQRGDPKRRWRMSSPTSGIRESIA